MSRSIRKPLSACRKTERNYWPFSTFPPSEIERDGTLNQATSTASYIPSAQLEMLVPGVMEERYENEYHTIDARADYSNFQRFGVEVKLDLGPVPK
jgi:hypothetical protein